MEKISRARRRRRRPAAALLHEIKRVRMRTKSTRPRPRRSRYSLAPRVPPRGGRVDRPYGEPAMELSATTANPLIHLQCRFRHVDAQPMMRGQPAAVQPAGPVQHHAAGSDLGAGADLYCPAPWRRPQQHAAAQQDGGRRVPCPCRPGHAVQHRTPSSTTAVSPITTPVPWSMKMPCRSRRRDGYR